MGKISSNLQTVSLYWEANIFTSDNGAWVLFSENNVCTGPSRIRFSIVSLCLWVLERYPGELYKDCQRQTAKQTVWTHRLVITSQPKWAIFFHRKSGWYMQKQRYQHLKALFIHFNGFSGICLGHKNDIPIQLGEVLKWQKILAFSFFRFMFGKRATKISEKIRLDHTIDFQNTFYTKSINIIMDIIGPSIIFSSIM